MKLQARPLTESDYDTILIGWWRDWLGEAPIRDFLPDNGCSGLMIEVDGIPVCAGFYYTTNSKIFWIDWIISDLNYRTKPDRGEALKYLISELGEIGKRLGFKYAYTLFKHPVLHNTYKNLGYVKGGEYTGEMIKIL